MEELGLTGETEQEHIYDAPALDGHENPSSPYPNGPFFNDHYRGRPQNREYNIAPKGHVRNSLGQFVRQDKEISVNIKEATETSH